MRVPPPPPPPARARSGGGQTWREPLPGPSAVQEGRAWGSRPGRVWPGRERTETPRDACPAGGVGAGPGGSSGPFRPGAACAVGACLFPVRGRLREHVGAGEEGGVRKGRWPASGGARGAPARGNSKARQGRRGRAWWGGGLQVGSWPLAALEWSLCALASRGLRLPPWPWASSPVAPGGGFFRESERGLPQCPGNTPHIHTGVWRSPSPRLGSQFFGLLSLLPGLVALLPVLLGS